MAALKTKGSFLLVVGLLALPTVRAAETFQDRLASFRAAYNNYRLRALHEASDALTRERDRLQGLLSSLRSAVGGTGSGAPAWSKEALPLEGSILEVSQAWPKLREALAGKRKLYRDDLALRFVETSDNLLEVLAGKEEFWPRLIQEMKGATQSIRIGIFGMQDDRWGRQVAEVLAERASHGVRVELLADRLGARMGVIQFNGSIKLKAPSAEMFKYMADSGVKYVLTSRTTGGHELSKTRDLIRDHSLERINDFFGYDHRKYVLIDGRVAFNTGYTFEQHMRERTFDVGVRIEGSLVRQMTLSHLLNWLYRGGKVDAPDVDAFLAKAFPPLISSPGTAKAKLVINIPGSQLPITESFYQMIENAKKRIYIIDPYPMDERIIAGLEEAAKHRLDVQVIVPLIPQNDTYQRNFERHYGELTQAGVVVHFYSEPEAMDLLHAKGILADGTVSLGSCNKDSFTLQFNFEQQIETSDPAAVDEALERVFRHAIAHSTTTLPERKDNAPDRIEAIKPIASPTLKPKPRD